MKKLSKIFISPFKNIDFNIIIQKSIEHHEEELLNLNKQQLDRGLDAKGESLGRYKHFKYKNRYEPVDLKLKGDYRNKLTLTTGEKKAEIFSQDWKDRILEKKYGNYITGISKQMMPTACEIIKETAQQEFENKIK